MEKPESGKQAFDKAQFLERIKGIVGEKQVLSDTQDISPYLTDWRGRFSGKALGLARPKNAKEVAAIVRECLAKGVPIVPQGGNTGLVGGATPDESGKAFIIQLSRLNRVREIDPLARAMIAEAGCTLAQIQTAAHEAGCLFPLSLASKGSCQIGGNLSTNAGGVQVLRYGTARDLTLGLEAVLPNGQLWEGLKTLKKDNTGYDLKNLLIGAEGTLGIITAVALKLFPKPQSRVVAWLGLDSPAGAASFLKTLTDVFDTHLTAFELICPQSLELVQRHIPDMPAVPFAPWHVLCEFSSALKNGFLEREVENFLSASLEKGAVKEALIAQTEAQQEKLWALRKNISEAQKREGVSIKHDISLPVSRIPEFLDKAAKGLEKAFPGIRRVVFGHLGDGSLHFNLSMADIKANEALQSSQEAVNRLVYDLTCELGGSISAEHGLGQLKRETLRRYKSPVELDAMQAIKKALDPSELMNPGKVL